jgi:transposase
VAKRVLALAYASVLDHDGWCPVTASKAPRHQPCLSQLLRRRDELLQTASRGAVQFPRRVKSLLQQALDLRDRHAVGKAGGTAWPSPAGT